MYEVGLFKPENYKNIEIINSHDAVDGSLELIRKVGLLAGPTSGSTYTGALQYLQKIDESLTEQKTAVFIACDRVETYISYFKKRRPELFHVREQPAFTITQTEVNEFAEQVTVEEVDDFIANFDPLIIDLRGAFAYAMGSVHESAINIPQASFESMFSAQGLPFPQNKKILLVCPTGEATRRFSAVINKQGGQAVSLYGGIAAWVNKQK
jgi:rhodanese-related sulfurtransferase